MMPSGWTRRRGSTWTWYIEDVPDPRTGRPHQVSKGGFRTRKEARDALLEAQAALRSGTFVEPSKRTVGSYLLEEWLPDNQPPRLRPSSFANYTIYTRTHVVPRLGDIDWRRGELTVAGKANRHERLPVPSDVGDAIAAYLTRGRPTTEARAVFVRAFAPYRKMSRNAVTNVAARAARRVGLGTIHGHRLRHSAATAMLHAGASLSEIGQVLRHRHALTTTIYAKVDIAALRTVARPWPGSGAAA